MSAAADAESIHIHRSGSIQSSNYYLPLFLPLTLESSEGVGLDEMQSHPDGKQSNLDGGGLPLVMKSYATSRSSGVKIGSVAAGDNSDINAAVDDDVDPNV